MKSGRRPQRQIVDLVWSVAPRLLISSGVRPNAGFHSQGLSIDFWSPVRAEIWAAFLALLKTDWPGGISIGIPTAEAHLHVDARQFDESGKKWPAVRFIETKAWNGKSSGEVCSFPGGATDPAWLATLDRARVFYTQ